MHTKINPDFIKPVDDWSIFKGKPRYSYTSYGVTIAYYEIANLDLFKSLHKYETLLPIEPEWIEMGEVTGVGHLYPHRDHGTSVSLNYYAHASLDTTNFYYAKPDAKPQAYPGKDVAHCYTYDDVELPPYESFTAKSNEAYLFRCKSIHDVTRVSPEPRIILCYQWANKSYNEVLRSLKDL